MDKNVQGNNCFKFYFETCCSWLRTTVIQHPPYSPDLAPTDFRLFCSLKNFLDGQEYADEAAINGFFDSLRASFFKSGIYKLVKRWEFAAKSGGEYCPNSFDE